MAVSLGTELAAQRRGGTSKDDAAVGQVVRLRALCRLESRRQQDRHACHVRRLGSGAHRGEPQVIVPELGDGGEQLGPEAAAAEAGRKPPAHFQAHGAQAGSSGNQAAGTVHGCQPSVVQVQGLASSAAWFHGEQAVAPRLGHQHPGRPAEPSLRLGITCRGLHDRPIADGWRVQPQIDGEHDVIIPSACLGRRPGPCSQHPPSSP